MRLVDGITMGDSAADAVAGDGAVGSADFEAASALGTCIQSVGSNGSVMVYS